MPEEETKVEVTEPTDSETSSDDTSTFDFDAVEKYEEVVSEREALKAERDALQSEKDELISERDNLAQQLDEAKTKFANAFLSSAQHAKEVQAQDVEDDGKSYSFSELFSERNKYNAN